MANIIPKADTRPDAGPKARPRPDRPVAGVQRLAAASLLGLLAGCGTTRLTDTQRTGTEQLLVSNAVDQAISQLDFSQLAGKSVFFDAQYLDGTVDRGYLVSSLRQQLLASGCTLQEERAKATYVVEARSGGLGTDRNAVLVGIPQMNVPTFVPGQPSQIPEIPFAKKTDQEGVAKIALFAYNRVTGQRLWQSGVVLARSTSKDVWVLGAGPFQQGTIRQGTEFAGELLPLPRFGGGEAENDQPLNPAVAVNQPAKWPERPAPFNDAKHLAEQQGNAVVETQFAAWQADLQVFKLLAGGSPALNSGDAKGQPAGVPSPADRGPLGTPPPQAKPVDPPPVANGGGQAETEPGRVLSSGMGAKPGNPRAETEPKEILDFALHIKPDG
jgi:hypothetical protein